MCNGASEFDAGASPRNDGAKKQNPPSFATAGFGVSAQTSSAALIRADYATALILEAARETAL